MLAGFVIGLGVGLFIAMFVYIYMDVKLYEHRHKSARVISSFYGKNVK